MSHLGRRLSALIDGELGDAERDQAHSHLVSCEACRAEAAALRTLKRRVHNLGETSADSALTRRLIALEGLPRATQPSPAGTRARPVLSAFSGAGAATRPPAWDSVFDWLGEPAALTESPLGGSAAAAGRGRGHTRYVVAGALAALAVGLGAASFAAGGERLPGPTVTPEVDVYNAQHAAMTGELPMLLPRTAAPPRRSPSPAGHPLHRAGQTVLSRQ